MKMIQKKLKIFVKSVEILAKKRYKGNAEKKNVETKVTETY